VIVVAFRLDVDKEAPFSEFYHHRYLPNLMRDVPEIKSARRYQEHHVTGSLRYYAKQFLTLFDCASAEGEQKALAAILARRGEDEWRRWHGSAVRDLDPPCIYRERWAHPRTPLDGPFGSRPFFMVSVELNASRTSRTTCPRTSPTSPPGWRAGATAARAGRRSGTSRSTKRPICRA
jgi:hypothetical protein